MKQLNAYLNESHNFLVNKKLQNRQDKYEYHHKTKHELQDIITELLKNGETDLNCIDVSQIIDMSDLFADINDVITIKIIDISNWNISNVTNMYCMFSCCSEFNSDLSNWDVSKVKTMGGMFEYCTKFNSDLSNWNISKVKNTAYMFDDCITLKKNKLIPKWYK